MPPDRLDSRSHTPFALAMPACEVPRLAAPLYDTLVAVARVMADAASPWWVISGAAAALHGVGGENGPEPGDVDVLLTVQDVLALLPGIGVTAASGPAHPRFRSELFATWADPPMTVDFMAGFCCRNPDDPFESGAWQPVVPRTRMRIALKEHAVFVPTRQDLQRLFINFGRPKDMARARLLAP